MIFTFSLGELLAVGGQGAILGAFLQYPLGADQLRPICSCYPA